MISSTDIERISRKEGVDFGVVEKDYFLTLLLEGIAGEPSLEEGFVFKGGTALRKIYFRHYRYSEDLDFTLRRPFSGEELEEHFSAVFAYLKKAHKADFNIKKINSKKWFTDLKIRFQGLKGLKSAIAIDLMSDELIVDEVRRREVYNPYYEKNFSMPTYSLEEILAEKLGALLRRTKVRDYYDCWYLLAKEGKGIDMKRVREIFDKKLKFRGIEFAGIADMFTSEKVGAASGFYARLVGSFIRDAPEFGSLIEELRKSLLESGHFKWGLSDGLKKGLKDGL